MRAWAFLLLALAAAPAAAEQAEQWIPQGDAATRVTGLVLLEPGRIFFGNTESLGLEAAGSRRDFSASGTPVAARLYRVVRPDNPLLLHRNRLCGGLSDETPVRFLVVWETGSGRHMAAYTGPSPPRGTEDGACRIYSYVLGTPVGSASARQTERWFPEDRATTAITGLVLLAPDRLTFGSGAALALEPAGRRSDFLVDGTPVVERRSVAARLYRVVTPADPTLTSDNRFCGGTGGPRPMRFIVVWGEGEERFLLASSSTSPPNRTGDEGTCGGPSRYKLVPSQ